MGAFQLVVTSTNLTAIPGIDTPLLAFKFRSVPWCRQRIGLELNRRIGEPEAGKLVTWPKNAPPVDVASRREPGVGISEVWASDERGARWHCLPLLDLSATWSFTVDKPGQMPQTRNTV